MRTYQVISADGHIEVPLDFAKRLAAKHRDLAPQLVTRDDGTHAWRMDQWEMANFGNLCCELDYDQWKPEARRYFLPDGSPRPGCGDAVQRLREQDLDGIDAEVLYPPVFASRFLRNLIPKDKSAYLAIVQAYNNFLALEYCSIAPDRLIGNGILPETGLDDAIAEMERCKKLGLPSICLASWPNGGSTYKPEDDRYFAAALDLDMKQSPHRNFGGGPTATSDFEPIMVLQGSGVGAFTIGQLILHGVFDRFPALKLYFAESQASWLPYNLTRTDDIYRRWGHYWGVKLKQMPSDYYRAHTRFSFTFDRLAVEFRYHIGLDLLMWGSDLPHSVGTFPKSREFLDDMFQGISDVERRKILVDNPCEFFDLDPERGLTPTP